MTSLEIESLAKVISQVDGGCGGCIQSASNHLIEEFCFSHEEICLYLFALNKNAKYFKFQFESGSIQEI